MVLALVLEVSGVKCHVLETPSPVLLLESANLRVLQEEGSNGQGRVVLALSEDLELELSSGVPTLKSGPGKFVVSHAGRFYGLQLPDQPELVARFEGVLQGASQYTINMAAMSVEERVDEIQAGERAVEDRLSQALADGGGDDEQARLLQAPDGEGAGEGAGESRALSDHRQGMVEAPKAAKMVAVGLEKSSHFVALGMVKGAELVGKGLKMGAEKVKGHTTPRETPTKLSERTGKAISNSEHIAAQARHSTRQMVLLVEQATQQLAEQASLAAGKSNAGRRFQNSKAAAGALEIVKAGLIAMGTLYEGAVEAGVTVVQQGAEASASVVRHKHGEEAGDAADRLAKVATDFGHTVRNANALRPKTVLKSGAVKFAKERADLGPDDAPKPIEGRQEKEEGDEEEGEKKEDGNEEPKSGEEPKQEGEEPKQEGEEAPVRASALVEVD